MEDRPGFREALLAWYRTHRRDLPWRRTRDPYAILVSEVLLQQTRIEAGTPYYRRFLERFPTVQALAAAHEEEVLQAWEGLGYYRRARLLHRAAREIVEGHGGEVPSTVEALTSLPGVGPYTAGAVASIAHGRAVPAVDGNVVRVLARLHCLEEDMTRAVGRVRVERRAAALVPSDDPGTFNQALMELGALVCLPQAPRCERCPVVPWCQARARGKESALPYRPRRTETPEVPAAFAVVERQGCVLLVQRRDEALLGGLWALPGGEVDSDAGVRDELPRLVRDSCGLDVDVESEVGRHLHTFSHKRWRAVALRCEAKSGRELAPHARWVPREDLENLPLVPFHRAFLENLVSPSLDRFS